MTPAQREALEHAEAILARSPDLITNCSGKGPSTTTLIALQKVRDALATESQTLSKEEDSNA